MAAKKLDARPGKFPEFPEGEYAVTLVDFGNNLKKPMQYLKKTFPLPPMALEHLKFFLPATIIRSVSRESADQIAADLSRTGASALVRSVGELSVEATAALVTKTSKRISATDSKTGIWSRTRKHETEQGDISKATNIQFMLLPKQIPDIPGYDMHVFYRSMSEVGGDYYDFIPIDGVENLGIIIADASGHGFSGAMVMTMARSMIRMLALRNSSAKDTMIKFNRFLSRDIKNVMFLTVMYMVLNIHTRTLQITNAGHNPLILLRGGRHQLINPTGMAVGFDLGPLFEKTLKDAIVQLQPGDRVIAYTDGVVETMDKAKQEFGMERFLEIVHDCGSKSSGEFLNKLMRELDQWRGRSPQNDDITVLTFKYIGVPESAATRAASGIVDTGFETALEVASSRMGSRSDSRYETRPGTRSDSRVEEPAAPAPVADPPGFESVDEPVESAAHAPGPHEGEEPAGLEEIAEFATEPEPAVPEIEPAELTPFPETEHTASEHEKAETEQESGADAHASDE